MTKEKIFKMDDIVWAKQKGYQPWPGIIASNDVKRHKKIVQYNVKFFGSTTYGWISPQNIWLYEENKDKFMKTFCQRIQNRGKVPNAVQEAEKFLEYKKILDGDYSAESETNDSSENETNYSSENEMNDSSESSINDHHLNEDSSKTLMSESNTNDHLLNEDSNNALMSEIKTDDHVMEETNDSSESETYDHVNEEARKTPMSETNDSSESETNDSSESEANDSSESETDPENPDEMPNRRPVDFFLIDDDSHLIRKRRMETVQSYLIDFYHNLRKAKESKFFEDLSQSDQEI